MRRFLQFLRFFWCFLWPRRRECASTTKRANVPPPPTVSEIPFTGDVRLLSVRCGSESSVMAFHPSKSRALSEDFHYLASSRPVLRHIVPRLSPANRLSPHDLGVPYVVLTSHEGGIKYLYAGDDNLFSQ